MPHVQHASTRPSQHNLPNPFAPHTPTVYAITLSQPPHTFPVQPIEPAPEGGPSISPCTGMASPCPFQERACPACRDTVSRSLLRLVEALRTYHWCHEDAAPDLTGFENLSGLTRNRIHILPCAICAIVNRTFVGAQRAAPSPDMGHAGGHTACYGQPTTFEPAP